MINTQSILVCSACFLFGPLMLVSQEEIEQEPRPASWVQDAQLNDVFFINPNQGWAVGEQGTILRTSDGGRRWQVVSTARARAREFAGVMSGIEEPDRIYDSVDIANQILRRRQSEAQKTSAVQTDGGEIQCVLNSVHFVDNQIGWAAGGYDLPYVDRSRGVVLRTRDGGRTWNPVSGLLLPRISKIQFSDRLNGWAVGDASSLYPGGLFKTTDGGNTWSSFSSGSEFKANGLEDSDWIDADKSRSGKVVVNRHGQLAIVRDTVPAAAEIDRPESGRVNSLTMLDGNRGIAVGNRGLLLKTTDGGDSWSRIEVGADLAAVDFNSVSHQGERIWVGGTPGSTLISLDKTTLAARAHTSPVAFPIRKIHFVDEAHGWAVGPLGFVISTTDGGERWNIQRGNFPNVAVMGVATDPQQIPHAVYAQLANEQDLICVNLLLDQRLTSWKARQSVTRQGVSVHLDQGPLEQVGQLESLVRNLRVFRPLLLVVGGDTSIQMLVSAAVQQAADPTAFTEQIELYGLKAWQVRRVAIPDPRGEIVLDDRKVLPRVGQTLGDSISLSRALVGETVRGGGLVQYRVESPGTFSSGRAGFLDGLGAGVTLPRRTGSRTRGNLEILRHLAGKQKLMEYLLSLQVKSVDQQTGWQKLIQQTTIRLQPEVAGVWLMQLAEAYREQGDFQLAALTLEALITLYPRHPLSFGATTWLIEMYSSDELAYVEYQKFRRMLEISGGGADVQTANYESVPTRFQVGSGPVLELWVPKSILKQAQDGVQQAGHSADSLIKQMSAEGFSRLRLQRASQLIMRLRQRDPDIATSQRVKFTEGRISNRLPGGSDKNQVRQLVRSNDPELRLSARREMALLDGRLPESGLGAWRVSKAGQRPVLDGRLDDPIWSGVTPSVRRFERSGSRDKFQNGVADQVVLAYDEEFLFIAAKCQKIKGQLYRSAERNTERDPDLTRRDRLQLEFDTDRDYATAFQIEVDYRGWVSEACYGGQSWNPTCYVSQSIDDESWSIEMAIPLRELTWRGPRPRQAWAARVNRIAYDGTSVWTDSKMTDAGGSQKLGYTAGRFELLEFYE